MKRFAVTSLALFLLVGCECAALRQEANAAANLYRALDVPALVSDAASLDEEQKARRISAAADLGTLLDRMGGGAQ